MARRRTPIAPPETSAASVSTTYNEAQLRAILETSVDGIITINEQGIIESFNRSAERIFGYPAHEVVGKNVSLLMPDPDRRQHDAYIANYLSTGEQKIIGIGRDVIGQRKDGSQVPLHLSVSEVRYENRRIFTGFVHDLTERLGYEAKLREAERLAALGEAMAGLAHESRNALQRIQVATEMLEEFVRDEAEASEYIQVIQRAQHDLQRVLQEVREYAAPIQLNYESVPIDSVLRKAWDDLAGERNGRSVDFVEQSECTNLHVEVDPYAMSQVLRNVLENALAACGELVKIEVHYRDARLHAADAMVVAIRDNGPGIPPEDSERVFDSFYTTKTKGTGLGLAISKRIVEAHGGEIVANPHYSAGGEFVVTLPRERP